MTIAPEARQRLARLMDERRRDLRLRWQDVAEAGGISLKTLHSVRTGEAGIAPLTERGIEAGLRWEGGTVEIILGGGDPVPAPPAAKRPRPVRRDVEFRGVGTAEALQPYVREVQEEAYEALVRYFPDDAPDDPSDPRAEAAMSALPGSAVFPGGDHVAEAEAATWDDAPFTLGERIKIIAIGRQLRAQADARENRRTGLSHYPVTGAVPLLFSVAGREFRASS